jgi:tetratricopeptide (TPR) repeat protein
MLEQSLEQAASMGIVANRALRLGRLAEVHLLGGRRDQALRTATQACRAAEEQQERGLQMYTKRWLADVVVSGNDADVATAESIYTEALRGASELAMTPLVAHCRLGLGRLQLRAGRPAAALEHLATATAMYRDLGMTRWLERAAAELDALA